MEELKEQYDRIYRYCFYKVGNREMAEDITQEAFTRSFAHLNKKPDIQYLYRVARNICIDEYRKIKEIPSEEIPEAEVPSFSEALIDNMALKEALNRLTDEEREILLLRFANDEQISVIADIYGISRFSLRRKIQNILAKCRRYMEGGTQDERSGFES